jgi:HEAT repeat protein
VAAVPPSAPVARPGPGAVARLALALALAGPACAPPAPSPPWQEHVVGTWRERLADEDPWVRAGAVEALGRLGDDGAAAAPDLLRLLESDPAEVVRARSARALGRIGHAPAREPLLRALEQGSLAVRKEAAAGLVALGAAERVLETLLGQLDARPDAESLQAVAHGFAALGPDAVEPLRRRLSPAAPDDARRAAALCLGQVGPPARGAVGPVAALLDEPDASLRLAAVLALGAIGGDEAVAALWRAAETDPEPSVRLEATIALAESARPPD